MDEDFHKTLDTTDFREWVDLTKKKTRKGLNITRIKTTLRQHEISFSAVNESKSGSTLYISIKQAENINEYERIVRDLFTNEHLLRRVAT
ncbi:unnamed protein product [Adineta steineri]|uniref:Uncharacterized protein n=1 Tax=Adineta steineri TaxID=433720 RepID=A0A820BLV5_9BILA|nr:unnamed protein product [Adineta steineri]